MGKRVYTKYGVVWFDIGWCSVMSSTTLKCILKLIDVVICCIGYTVSLDLEGESGVIARASGTACTLVKQRREKDINREKDPKRGKDSDLDCIKNMDDKEDHKAAACTKLEHTEAVDFVDKGTSSFESGAKATGESSDRDQGGVQETKIYSSEKAYFDGANEKGLDHSQPTTEDDEARVEDLSFLNSQEVHLITMCVWCSFHSLQIYTRESSSLNSLLACTWICSLR